MAGSVRRVGFYGAGFGLGAFCLVWLETHYLWQTSAAPVYLSLVAMVFMALGAWMTGVHLRWQSQPGRSRRVHADRPTGGAEGLSAAEMRVLRELATGASNQEIAAALFVSISTIKTHLVHIYQKLGVSRRTQAVNVARQLKIIG